LLPESAIFKLGSLNSRVQYVVEPPPALSPTSMGVRGRSTWVRRNPRMRHCYMGELGFIAASRIPPCCGDQMCQVFDRAFLEAKSLGK
jgi:hypothetical protein